MTGWHWLAIHVPILAGVALGVASPPIYRRWKKNRCKHGLRVMGTNGKTLCLDCWKSDV